MACRAVSPRRQKYCSSNWLGIAARTLVKQPELGSPDEQLGVRLNATIAANVQDRDSPPLQRRRHQQAPVAAAGILLCAHDRGRVLVRELDQPFEARPELGRAGSACMV